MLIELINLDVTNPEEMAFAGSIAEKLNLVDPLLVNLEKVAAAHAEKAIAHGWGEGAARMAKWLPLGQHRSELKESVSSEEHHVITINHALTMVLADKGSEGPVFSIVPLEACCGSSLPDLCILIDGSDVDLATLNGLNQNILPITRAELVDPDYDFTQMINMTQVEFLKEIRKSPAVMDQFEENLFKVQYIDSVTREPLFFDFLRLPNTGVNVTVLNEETLEPLEDIDVSELKLDTLISVTPPGENVARVIGRIVAVTPIKDLEPPTIQINAHDDLCGYLEAESPDGAKVRQLVKEGDTMTVADTGRPITISEMLNLKDGVIINHPLHKGTLNVTGITPALPTESKTQSFVQLLATSGTDELTFTTRVYAGDAITMLDEDGDHCDAEFDTSEAGVYGSVANGDSLLVTSSQRIPNTVYQLDAESGVREKVALEDFTVTCVAQIRGPKHDKMKIAYKMSDSVDRVGEVDACALMVVVRDPNIPEELTYTQVAKIDPETLLYNSDGKGTHNYFLVTSIG